MTWMPPGRRKAIFKCAKRKTRRVNKMCVLVECDLGPVLFSSEVILNAFPKAGLSEQFERKEDNAFSHLEVNL
ncbi:Hypothetical predicted protein [Podarcis lilfordi]|uniref:Uncharacterized protein n=1 Tax=Podarcis lilfordi TaxID=74358 RepID=A0AA35LFY2_9SAUR|nr:Hypothetical predicted protein [Podarcis lilfordi]